MDETELLEVLVARSMRGRPRGADTVVDVVATQLAPTRPRRRRGRHTWIIVVAATAVFVAFVAGPGARRDAQRSSLANGGARVSTSIGSQPDAQPEAIVSVHPIDRRITWVLTTRRVLSTSDAGKSFATVMDTPPAAAAFQSADRGVVVERAGRRLTLDLVSATGVQKVSGIDTGLASVDEVHITRTPDQYVVWASARCGRADACATVIFASVDGSRWETRYRGNGLRSIRCAKGGDCWAFSSTYDGASGRNAYALVHSPTGGRDWVTITAAPVPSTRGAPAAVDILTVTPRTLSYEMIDGADGADVATPVIVVTTDDGASFRSRPSPVGAEPSSSSSSSSSSSPHPYSAVVRHANGSWTALHDRDVLEARDDSLRWDVVARTPFVVRFARWADAYVAWIAGDTMSQLAYTVDGGRVWRRVDLTAVAP